MRCRLAKRRRKPLRSSRNRPNLPGTFPWPTFFMKDISKPRRTAWNEGSSTAPRERSIRVCCGLSVVWNNLATTWPGSICSALTWRPGEGQLDQKVCVQPVAVTALAISPNGTLLLTGGPDGTTRVCASGGQLNAEGERVPSKVIALGWAADGKEWVVADGHEVQRRELSGKPVGEPLQPPGSVLTMTREPNGKLMMMGTCEQGVWLSEEGGREGAKKAFTPDSPVYSAAMSPDVKIILSGHEDQSVRLWDGDGQPRGSLPRQEGPVRAVAVSADGSLLATAAAKTVQLWDMATRRPIGRPLIHPTDVLALAFAPDGQGLLSGDQSGIVRRWPLVAPRNESVPRLKLWVEEQAGMELDGAGNTKLLSEPGRRRGAKRLQSMEGPPKR